MTSSIGRLTSKRPHVPAYREHKPSGQARVTIDGKQIYLARISHVGWVKIAQLLAWVSPAERVRETSRGCQTTGKPIEDPRRKRLARPTLQDEEKCGLASPVKG
jgi:hypothetical protein